MPSQHFGFCTATWFEKTLEADFLAGRIPLIVVMFSKHN